MLVGQGLSSAGALLQRCELCLKNAAFQRWSEEVIENEGVQEVNGENAAPDPGYPLDPPAIVRQYVDCEYEEYDGNEDREVMEEADSLVCAVSGFVPQVFFRKRAVIAVLFSEVSSHPDPHFPMDDGLLSITVRSAFATLRRYWSSGTPMT